MVVLAVASCFYLLIDATVINATTVSGTYVMGLGPPIFLMLFWRCAQGSAPEEKTNAHGLWRQPSSASREEAYLPRQP